MNARLAIVFAAAAAVVVSACGEAAVFDPPPETSFVALAEAVDRASDAMDAARHRVERGEAMGEALGLVRGLTDQAEDATRKLAAVAVTVDGRERALLERAVAATHAAVPRAHREVEYLGWLVDADRLLDRAVAAWRPGGGGGVEPAELEARAAWLAGQPVEPVECRGMRDRRVGWLRLVAERTRTLAQADADDSRQSFLLQPFGEDRRLADASDRQCWLANGALPRAAEVIEEQGAAWARFRARGSEDPAG